MTVHDLVGVGIGPFNLSLAALADHGTDLDCAFFDAKPAFAWHPGLLLEGTTLQVPFLADLVTLVDPTSRWSFLSYLREHDRLFPFYFAERFHVPRREYDHYCRWVAESLPQCRFGHRVEAVRKRGAGFTVEACDVHTGRSRIVRARNVVLGVGAEPVVPAALHGLVGKRVFHAADYLDRSTSLHEAGDVTVVGSGQSGAEVFLDLLRRQTDTGQRLRWLTRSPAFAPMEYSKLGLEHFTPDYTRYFQQLPEPTRDGLLSRQGQLYKAISAETIAEIADLLYERGIGGARPDVTLMPNVAVCSARHDGGQIELGCDHAEQRREFTVHTDRVIAATGYAPREPECLAPLSETLARDSRGRYRVGPDYRIADGLYVQNAELHTHGVGAPDLGLGAYRAAVILNAITGRRAYRLPQHTANITFGAPPP